MQSKDIKYLGVGLGIGVTVMSLFLGVAFLIPGFRNYVLPAPKNPTQEITTQGNLILDIATNLPVANTQTPLIITNTLEFTLTPTQIPIPTNTTDPLITPTLSPADLLLATGELAIVGPLSKEQQLSLYNASLTFIAPTYEESKKMSVAINGLRFSDPNTTCGPLSIAILQKASIINIDNVPHDFFLINPDNVIDRRLLEKAFPNEQYTNTRYKIKLNEVNWLAQPLMPGDFLYIYAGEEGNFEHMLIVTRVDAMGRAYSVNNYNTAEGFIINEALLYDPSDPTVGVFAQWTKRKDQLLGSTGFAGYEVWRLNN